jgi:hypothetical protein
MDDLLRETVGRLHVHSERHFNLRSVSGRGMTHVLLDGPLDIVPVSSEAESQECTSFNCSDERLSQRSCALVAVPVFGQVWARVPPVHAPMDALPAGATLATVSA